MAVSAQALRELGRVDDLTVDLSSASREGARTDKSGHISPSVPDAVVVPRSIAAVQETMRWASKHDVAVVPRGAGSGLAGGAIAQRGEVVVSLHDMNRILEISPADRLARVEPGVINSNLNTVAKGHGLWFAPDPASRQWSSVGGNIATNAGGLLCAKYGVTRESVLELAVVLADGRLIRTGHRTVKGVTGLDLTSLFVGSEGILGIIVEATVRLLPLPTDDVWTLAARFRDIAAAADSCQELATAGHTPAVLEIVDDIALGLIHGYLERPAPPPGEVLVIAQSDRSNAADDVAGWAELCRRNGAVVDSSGPGEQADALLALRQAMHPAMEKQGRVLIEDVAVPRSRLREMFLAIRELEQDRGLRIPTVAHAADGNLHPNFIVDSEVVPETIWEAAGELFNRAIALGGTLTGEHGVGLLKRRWLRAELGDDQWQLQRDIKAVFDPQGLLNPGKVFGDDAML